jgi:hypothetical protein
LLFLQRVDHISSSRTLSPLLFFNLLQLSLLLKHIPDEQVYDFVHPVFIPIAPILQSRYEIIEGKYSCCSTQTRDISVVIFQLTYKCEQTHLITSGNPNKYSH